MVTSAVDVISVGAPGAARDQTAASSDRTWEFRQTFCINIPKMKQGETKGLDSESFQVPANLQAAPKFKVTVIAPAKDCYNK